MHTTKEAKERWKDQKFQIIDLYKKVRVELLGKNGKKSLKPMYPFLKREGLPCHINTLRKIFDVDSLIEIVIILEESLSVPKQK